MSMKGRVSAETQACSLRPARGSEPTPARRRFRKELESPLTERESTSFAAIE
jgi:hypothetical protein